MYMWYDYEPEQEPLPYSAWPICSQDIGVEDVDLNTAVQEILEGGTS